CCCQSSGDAAPETRSTNIVVLRAGGPVRTLPRHDRASGYGAVRSTPIRLEPRAENLRTACRASIGDDHRFSHQPEHVGPVRVGVHRVHDLASLEVGDRYVVPGLLRWLAEVVWEKLRVVLNQRSRRVLKRREVGGCQLTRLPPFAPQYAARRGLVVVPDMV